MTDFSHAAAAVSRNADALDKSAFDALSAYGKDESASVRAGGRPTLAAMIGSLSDGALLNLCARSNFVGRMAGAYAGVPGMRGAAAEAVALAAHRIAGIAEGAAPAAGGHAAKRLESSVAAMAGLVGAAGECGGDLRGRLIEKFADALYSAKEARPAVEKAVAGVYAGMGLDSAKPFWDKLDAFDFRDAVRLRSRKLTADERESLGTKAACSFDAAVEQAVVARLAIDGQRKEGIENLPGHTVSGMDTADGGYCQIVRCDERVSLDPRIGPAVMRRGADGAVTEGYFYDGEPLGRTRDQAIENFRDMFPAGLPPLPPGYDGGAAAGRQLH